MADRRQQLHLVAYDIADSKRLQRVHRILKGWGVAVQYSMFNVHSDRIQLQQLIAVLQSEIDPKADDIRIYSLPERIQMDTLGCQDAPEGLMLVHKDGHDLLHPGQRQR